MARHGETAGHSQTRTCHRLSRSMGTPAAPPPGPQGTGSWGTPASCGKSRRTVPCPWTWAVSDVVPSSACSGTRPAEEIACLVLYYRTVEKSLQLLLPKYSTLYTPVCIIHFNKQINKIINLIKTLIKCPIWRFKNQ